MAKQARHFLHIFQKKYRDPIGVFFRNRDRELSATEVFNSFEQETIRELLRLNVLLEEDSGEAKGEAKGSDVEFKCFVIDQIAHAAGVAHVQGANGIES